MEHDGVNKTRTQYPAAQKRPEMSLERTKPAKTAPKRTKTA
jgi:hypothetical protein